MSQRDHLDGERLLHYADGAELGPDEVQHLVGCGHCQQQLAELAAFEAAVAAHTPMAPADRQRAQAGTLAVLDRAAAPRRWRPAAAALATAAALLLATWLWWPGAANHPVIVCARPDPSRAEAVLRFHVECELPAASWPLLWAEQADGALLQLLPNADPLLGYLGASPPLAAGQHRLPASSLFDFEFAPTTPPRALLLVANDREWNGAELAALALELATRAPAGRKELLQERFKQVWQVPFGTR